MRWEQLKLWESDAAWYKTLSFVRKSQDLMHLSFCLACVLYRDGWSHPMMGWLMWVWR